MLIRKEKSVLVLIDAQESLIPVVSRPRDVIDGCARLVRGANLMHVPVVATEQYPKGLGATLFDIRQHLGDATVIEKRAFSAYMEPAFPEKMTSLQRPQVILAGVELHICVLQTALELKQAGYQPFVVMNACSSRHDVDFQVGKERLISAGIVPVTVESVLYEWLETSAAPEFKELHKHLLY